MLSFGDTRAERGIKCNTNDFSQEIYSQSADWAIDRWSYVDHGCSWATILSILYVLKYSGRHVYYILLSHFSVSSFASLILFYYSFPGRRIVGMDRGAPTMPHNSPSVRLYAPANPSMDNPLPCHGIPYVTLAHLSLSRYSPIAWSIILNAD